MYSYASSVGVASIALATQKRLQEVAVLCGLIPVPTRSVGVLVLSISQVGLLSSVFKGSMNTLKAWQAVTGPRLALYHLEDAIIKCPPPPPRLCHPPSSQCLGNLRARL